MDKTRKVGDNFSTPNPSLGWKTSLF